MRLDLKVVHDTRVFFHFLESATRRTLDRVLYTPAATYSRGALKSKHFPFFFLFCVMCHRKRFLLVVCRGVECRITIFFVRACVGVAQHSLRRGGGGRRKCYTAPPPPAAAAAGWQLDWTTNYHVTVEFEIRHVCGTCAKRWVSCGNLNVNSRRVELMGILTVDD